MHFNLASTTALRLSVLFSNEVFRQGYFVTPCVRSNNTFGKRAPVLIENERKRSRRETYFSQFFFQRTVDHHQNW